jgi:peptide/nickel transport system substrate-binding protein
VGEIIAGVSVPAGSAPSTAPAVSRRRLLSGAVAIAALAACGGAAAPTPLPQTKPTVLPALATAAAAPGTPVATPVAKAAGPVPPTATPPPATGRPSVFTFALESDPGSWDGQREISQAAVDAHEHVYEALTTFDEKLEVVPSLATVVDRTGDGLAYRFHIDPAARFHDGGEVTAEDVKWTIDRLLSPETRSPWAEGWLEPVRGATVVDKQTVRIDLKRPFPALPGVLASLRGTAIYPRDVDQKLKLAGQANGTGPFKLKEHVPGERIVYERNAAYRLKEQPRIDGMVARVIPSEEARAQALRSGQIDYATFSPEGMSRLQGAPDLRLLGTPMAWIGTVALPVQQFPQFKDPRVRRAFSLAIDREEIVKRALLTGGTLSGNVPAGYGDWALPDAELRTLLRRDVGAAKQLLAEAGFPDGRNFPKVRWVTSPQYPEMVASAQVLRENLREVGLDFEVALMEWGAYVALTAKGDQELGLQIASFYPDPDLYLWPTAHSRSLVGQRGYRHARQEEVDRLLDEVRAWSGSREERRAKVQQIDRMLLEDPPQLVLYARLNLEAVSTRVKEYRPSYTGRRTGFRAIALG